MNHPAAGGAALVIALIDVPCPRHIPEGRGAAGGAHVVRELAQPSPPPISSERRLCGADAGAAAPQAEVRPDKHVPQLGWEAPGLNAPPFASAPPERPTNAWDIGPSEPRDCLRPDPRRGGLCSGYLVGHPPNLGLQIGEAREAPGGEAALLGRLLQKVPPLGGGGALSVRRVEDTPPRPAASASKAVRKLPRGGGVALPPCLVKLRIQARARGGRLCAPKPAGEPRDLPQLWLMPSALAGDAAQPAARSWRRRSKRSSRFAVARSASASGRQAGRLAKCTAATGSNASRGSCHARSGVPSPNAACQAAAPMAPTPLPKARRPSTDLGPTERPHNPVPAAERPGETRAQTESRAEGGLFVRHNRRAAAGPRAESRPSTSAGARATQPELQGNRFGSGADETTHRPGRAWGPLRRPRSNRQRC